MKLMLMLIRTPAWANESSAGDASPIQARGTLPPDRPGDYADFAEAVARRYPSVRLWMAWGEPIPAGELPDPLPHARGAAARRAVRAGTAGGRARLRRAGRRDDGRLKRPRPRKQDHRRQHDDDRRPRPVQLDPQPPAPRTASRRAWTCTGTTRSGTRAPDLRRGPARERGPPTSAISTLLTGWLDRYLTRWRAQPAPSDLHLGVQRADGQERIRVQLLRHPRRPGPLARGRVEDRAALGPHLHARLAQPAGREAQRREEVAHGPDRPPGRPQAGVLHVQARLTGATVDAR